MSGQLHALAALPSGKDPPPGTYWIGGWGRGGAELVWTTWRGEKSDGFLKSEKEGGYRVGPSRNYYGLLPACCLPFINQLVHWAATWICIKSFSLFLSARRFRVGDPAWPLLAVEQ
jgi:hypothetical protein